MDANIRISKFKQLVQQYRLATGVDVTAYALNFSYKELQAGRKTPLVEKIEWMENRKLLKGIDHREPHETIVSLEKRLNMGREMVDFRDPLILDKILDPKDNLPSKSDTYKRADRRGKSYVFVPCKDHGLSLHRTTYSWTEKRGEQVKKYNAYCLYCKISIQKKAPERIQHVRELTEKFLHSQKAS